jgi:hypothetical protein
MDGYVYWQAQRPLLQLVPFLYLSALHIYRFDRAALVAYQGNCIDENRDWSNEAAGEHNAASQPQLVRAYNASDSVLDRADSTLFCWIYGVVRELLA